jgi:hypothetical protein
MTLLRTRAWHRAGHVGGGTALADCGIASGNVNILGNDFGAIQAIVAGAKECASDTVTVESNLTTEHRDIQVAALTANPAQYTSAIVANSSIVPLMNDGLIRPLDDLIAEHGQDLQIPPAHHHRRQVSWRSPSWRTPSTSIYRRTSSSRWASSPDHLRRGVAAAERSAKCRHHGAPLRDEHRPAGTSARSS